MSSKKKEKKLSKSEVEIIDLKKERDDFKNIAARAQADLVNYRNRMKMELSEIENRGKKTVSLKVLSVIDEFDLALDNSYKSEVAKTVIDGLDIIREKFRTTFESEKSKIEPQLRFVPTISLLFFMGPYGPEKFRKICKKSPY